jgi:hypothetical protein
MRRKLCVLAVLVGTCAFAIVGRPPSAAALTFPLCSSSYCPTHQSKVCTCPPGTLRAGGVAPCDTWMPDCNDL